MKPMIVSPNTVGDPIEGPKKQRKSLARGKPGGRRKATSSPVSGSPTLELYQSESCAFSHSVRSRLSALGLDYIAHNVSKSNALKHKQLVQAGGKDRIPFLVDHRTGVKLYESGAILAYLDNEYGEPAPNRLLRAARKLNTQLKGRADQVSWTLRKPLEMSRSLRRQASDTLETIRGSARLLREIFRNATDLGSKQEGESQPEAAEQRQAS
jgi:glutathione S-transferase